MNYKCSICGRENVKLWRPYMDIEPLICATCAEERQSPWEYDEVKWEKQGPISRGIPTGRKLPLPKWVVDEKGKIPSYDGPGPDGKEHCKTDQLMVNLSDVSSSYRSGQTSMVPAVPCENGSMWGYTSVPQEGCDWWNALPTH